MREYLSTDLNVKRASPAAFSEEIMACRRDNTYKGPGAGRGLACVRNSM